MKHPKDSSDELENTESIRKILITNDDGIEARGLRRLVEVVQDLGEIWIVAPDGERSTSSHAITLHGSIDIYPYDYGIEGVNAFTCSGTPGDCVRVGSLSVMPYKPDVVLSGVNNGYNTATDIQYSGTCGAAFEAAFQGFIGIALSEGQGGVHEVTDKYLREIVIELIDKKLEFGQIWNVNFPNCNLTDFQEILRDRKISISMFFVDRYQQTACLDNGGARYMIDGRYQEKAEEGTDIQALIDNSISISIVNNVGI